MTTTDPPGLDTRRLSQYLDQRFPGLAGGQLSAEVIAGGRSNLTYTVTDGQDRWVVRRPPLGHVLATAHDMGREYRVMDALRDTPVPVPEVLALCQDEEVLGAPFYVMNHVDGTVLREAAQTATLGAPRAEALSQRLVRVLLELHSVDPEMVGLRDFGRPDGFLRRQVTRWGKQAAASRSREIPDLDALWSRLDEEVPETQAHTIVHGDYRLDNAIIDEADTIAAVLDWEMSTLGDPLCDLGLLRVYWDGLGDIPPGLVTDAVTSQAGFLPSASLVATYAESTELDLTPLAWYEALAYYKLAVILEGIHYRYLRGQTVGEGFAGIGDVVPPLAAAGLRKLG